MRRTLTCREEEKRNRRREGDNKTWLVEILLSGAGDFFFSKQDHTLTFSFTPGFYKYDLSIKSHAKVHQTDYICSYTLPIRLNDI